VSRRPTVLLVHPGIYEDRDPLSFAPWGLLCVASALRSAGVGAFRYLPLPGVPLTGERVDSDRDGIMENLSRDSRAFACQDYSEYGGDYSSVAVDNPRFEEVWTEMIERRDSRYARYGSPDGGLGVE